MNAAAKLVDFGSAAGVFEKSGAFYSYRGERIAQGREKAAAYLAEHAAVAAEIRGRLIDARRAELAGSPPLTAADAAAA